MIDFQIGNEPYIVHYAHSLFENRVFVDFQIGTGRALHAVCNFVCLLIMRANKISKHTKQFEKAHFLYLYTLSKSWLFFSLL